MGSASGFCVRCSPVRDSLEIGGGPADSQAPQWPRHLTTDGQRAVSRAADTKITGWTLWDTHTTWPIAGTLTTPGLDRGKSCVGLWGVSPRDGYLAHNTTQGTQENLPTVAEVTASIRA